MGYLPWHGRTARGNGGNSMSEEMTLKSTITEAEGKWTGAWLRHRSIALMILAQLISSLMAVAAKLLQTASKECGALDTSQVLVMMMSVTMVLSWLWMFLARVPEAPFGARNIWPLLTIRGVVGVFGIWGFYYSLRYLPLSEATVINFLAPMVAAFASSLIGRVPFTIPQQLAGAISILGVVLVSQPWHMFADIPPYMPEITNGNFTICKNCTNNAYIAPSNPSSVRVTSLERITAIGAALVGVAGGAAAYVVMALIGKNAHPAVNVNHFAAWTVVLTSLSLVVTGVEAFRMPSPSEWGLLVFLGIFGLLLHMLVAASLQSDGSNRALNMVYMQIVFALIMDEAVWGLRPNWVSLVGGVLILGSVVTVAIVKEQRKDEAAHKHGLENEVCNEEEIEMMIGKDERDSTDEER